MGVPHFRLLGAALATLPGPGGLPFSVGYVAQRDGCNATYWDMAANLPE